jgi:predicted transcriptional regulator
MSRGTTLRNVRVPDELWDAALTRAQRDDTNLSEIIRQALAAYVDHEKQNP